MAEQITESKLTKHDHLVTYFRHQHFLNTSSSFDRLYGIGFAYSISKALEKLYPEKEDLAKALTRESTTYITEPTYGAAIYGATVAMEEAKSQGEDVPDEIIVNFKTGLMGPVAGFGDSLNWATLMPLLKAIFLPLAYACSVLGAVGELALWWVYVPLVGWAMYNLGYKQGRNSIFTLLGTGIVQKLLVGASVMGMFMMGVMAANYVSLATPLTITSGEVAVSIQAVLDNILPGLLPFLAIVGTYLFLSKKGKYTQLLIWTIVICVVLSFFGIL